jgi:hypothetical protein
MNEALPGRIRPFDDDRGRLCKGYSSIHGLSAQCAECLGFGETEVRLKH